MSHIRAVIYRRAAIAVLAITVSAASAHAQTDSTALLRAQPSVHIDNFGIVNARYYRGAQPIGRDFEDLAALGVKTVIDLTDDDGAENEETLVEAAGMSFVKIPMSTREEPTSQDLDRFLDIVNDPAAQPVYVHCVGGRHRTGVMTAVYRMTAEGWSGEQAFKEMKHYKYGADFLHPEFKKFVLAYKPAVEAPAGAVATVATIE